jgi:hypothetical protein
MRMTKFMHAHEKRSAWVLPRGMCLVGAEVSGKVTTIGGMAYAIV